MLPLANSSLSERVLARLNQAEDREPNVWFRDDIRIAWITVLRAARGEAIPHVTATYAVLGLHPDKVWPAIMARRRAQLGTLYEAFYPFETAPPKKPSASVKRSPQSLPQVGPRTDSKNS